MTTDDKTKMKYITYPDGKKYIKYEDAVKEGKEIMRRINEAEWTIAAWACFLEDTYGEENKDVLRRFARAIDMPLDDLRKYRDTGRAFPNQLRMYYDQIRKDTK
jgi:hypothetical protein